LKSLEDLPPLSELKDIDAINEQLILSEPPEADNVETADTEMKKPELQDVVVEETEEDEDKKMDEMDTVDDIDVSDMAGVVKIDSAIDNDEEQPSNEALTAEN